MEYNKSIIENILFKGLNEEEINEAIRKLDGRVRTITSEEIIFHAGDDANYVGIVLKGAINIIKDDSLGNTRILAALSEGEVFGEVFPFVGIKKYPVSAQAVRDSEILLLRYGNLLWGEEKTNSILIKNMLNLMARKNILLNQKNDILSKRTIREKVICFLSYESRGRKEFVIPLNREEMAMHLAVDRSALSKELAKMKKDGIIDYNKNKFVLKALYRAK